MDKLLCRSTDSTFVGNCIYIYILLNTFDILPEQLRTYGYFRVSDSWSNNRGGIWRVGIIAFIRLVLNHPYVWLFGAGPD